MAVSVKYALEGNVLTLGGAPVKVYSFQDDPQAPWFQAKPIHNFLGATKLGQSVARVHEEDKATLDKLMERKGVPIRDGLTDGPPPTLASFGYRSRTAIYVNESGLYALIMGSQKKEAQAFQRWVTKNVLPTIRCTGRYELQGHGGAEQHINKSTAEMRQVALSQPLHIGNAAEIAEVLKAPVLEVIRTELQRSHPWDFQRRGRHANPLMEVGVMLEGDALVKLDEDEHVIRITDFLREQVSPDSWKRHGNKFKNIFAIELKKQKQQMCADREQPLYITKVQGEFRIVYTEADDDLMQGVFQKCKRRFQGIATRDEALLKGSQKKRRLEDYFFIGATTGANISSSSAGSPTSSANIVLHRENVAEAPAALRLRAKRGVEDIDVVES